VAVFLAATLAALVAFFCVILLVARVSLLLVLATSFVRTFLFLFLFNREPGLEPGEYCRSSGEHDCIVLHAFFPPERHARTYFRLNALLSFAIL
jgi:hypothetical protein